ncbi:MAG: hydroxymethylglutaryl-CoA reductase [Aquificales bacterium]|nr:hydroxymethylglutaryl-CoA reductase [Aquificales bacterium]
MKIPSLILKQLYTFGSLENVNGGVQFSVKNRLSDAALTSLTGVKFDGKEVPIAGVTILLADGTIFPVNAITADDPLHFPLREILTIRTAVEPLPEGKHKLEIAFSTTPFGDLKLKVDDSIVKRTGEMVRIPRDKTDDYSEAIIADRQTFVEKFTGQKMNHTRQYSFDPHTTAGNIEHFTGAVQIPLGFAGPLTVHGEHAQGDFLIPLATTEGTLVASYNRGIKILNLSGGVTCSIVGDSMQRAPVFSFNDAREARDFSKWIYANMDQIRGEAEATSSVAKLQYIDTYLASRFVYLRFNYTTGDAAGQNMVGRATFAASGWILDHYPKPDAITHFFLESNFATDKKASQINIMRTRGKRVTAECTVKRDVLINYMRVEPESLSYHYGVANIGAILSGANNNGLHSANAITAIFMATGQDVANVSESSAGILYTELTDEGDLYMSITIPSLIVATFGGGVGLATQKECLDLLGCFGKGKVNKFAEIIAGAVLAGEISLAAAIASSDWVSSHEKYGRNR